MRSRYGLAYKSRNNYAFQIDFRREIAQSPQGISLVEALLLNQWTNVSNAKDIVYCVLGLVVAEDKKAMRVDYSTKYRTNDLFLDIARPLAESGNGIVLLLFADKSRMLDLPSWCPDVSPKFDFVLCLNMYNGRQLNFFDSQNNIDILESGRGVPEMLSGYSNPHL